MQHLIRRTFYVYSCHFPFHCVHLAVHVPSLFYYHEHCYLFFYVGRSDKKDSCGALYFEKVSLLSMEVTLWVSCCRFYLSLPGRQAAIPPRMEPCAFSKWFKRGRSLQLCVSGLTMQAPD